MLKLHIHPQDVGGSWKHADGTYSHGRSWVACYRHPALEDFQCTDGARRMIVVRERRPTARPPAAEQVNAATYDQALAEAAAWPLDYTLVELAHGEIAVSAGAFGTAPVYLTVAPDGSLHGSWDLAEVAAATTQVDSLALVRHLTYWYRYSHRTVLDGVVQVTERGRALLDRNGLLVSYPEPAEHTLPRPVRADADLIGGIDAILTAVVNARVYDPDKAAVELSGGIDSATVAATLGVLDPDVVWAAGLLIPGAAGAQQARRRVRMRDAFRLGPDVTVVACDRAPLHPAGDRAQGLPVSPSESMYGEAETELLGLLAAHGVRTVYTGLGGDELMSLRPWESEPLDWRRQHPPWLTAEAVDMLEAGETDVAPAAPISEVTLMSFAAGATLYLRHGLWPVSPLAHPELITFAEWLPTGWRKHKRILRQRLIRQGLPAEMADPPLRENLAGVMSHGLQRWGLDVLESTLGDLALEKLGLVDVDRLRQACQDARAAGAARETDHALYQVVTTELFLRALGSSSRTRRGATLTGPAPPAAG